MLKKKMSSLRCTKKTIACLLSLVMLTGSVAVGTAASETNPEYNSTKLDVDVREALERGAITLYIFADVNISAEHSGKLQQHQQATVSLKHSTRDKQDALNDRMYEARKQLEKNEISQEAYDTLCQELQPQIDALEEAYLNELDALTQETEEIAKSEYEGKLAQWGDKGNILYAGGISALSRYVIKGELTTEQIINLINDEDVGFISLPVDSLAAVEPAEYDVTPEFNSTKLDDDVREALKNGATKLSLFADVNMSAEHYALLQKHQQETVALKHTTRDKQDALNDRMYEARKQFEKNEISQEAYDTLCQELQPQIDALEEAYLKELDALTQETEEIAKSEYESKLAQWGDKGNILYAGGISALSRYVIKGELTAEQIMNLINDEDVAFISFPVDSSTAVEPSDESLYEIAVNAGPGDVILTPGQTFTFGASVQALRGGTFRVKQASFIQVSKMNPDDPACVYSQIEWEATLNAEKNMLIFNAKVTGGDVGFEKVQLVVPKDMGISIINPNGVITDLNDINVGTVNIEVKPEPTEPETEPTEPETEPTEPETEPTEPETEPTEPKTEPQRIFGDFNNDGLVNASDASIILIYAAEHGAGKFAGTFEEYINR